ncbi:MAG: ThuA domain-containing protein [Verrucomicrobiota bacterium]
MFILLSFSPLLLSAEDAITYPGGAGPGSGKHIVLISGDEEYRSEESLPMLGKILSRRHGFKCTILFAINKKTGEIDPNTLDNVPGLQALESVDLMLVNTRFRDLPDEQMKFIHAYLQSGKPVIGIRPALVGFRHKNKGKGLFDQYSCDNKLKGGFGLNVLGADWISHHGKHGSESTRGIPNADKKNHPILRGVDIMWGSTDVYTVHTPIKDLDAVLVHGQVLDGMNPSDPPSDKQQMPLAWTRSYSTPKGKARVFTSTMGDARDFLDENFRRLIVNACFWAVGLEEKIPSLSNVDLVGPYNPSPFGFKRFVKGRRPSDHAIHASTKLLFKSGERICFLGNTLADRMQHHGWTETLLQARHPNKNLVFRNLGFAADELNTRPRSLDFGSPDSHLRHSRADTIFAFFGYNESFNGEEGLASFKQQLTTFIDHSRNQKYNGVSAPRLVLFSPIAHENLNDPNLPDGKENNRRLALYSRAMAGVAAEKGVLFIDLFSPTKKLYADHSEPLTINGIHLNQQGYQLLSQIIDRALADDTKHTNPRQLEKIRQAVLAKNLRWFNRYRTTDGYSTYGKRAYLKFVDDQTNKDVMDRELEIIDVMTANRDRHIWSLAQGHDNPVDDSNLPSPLTVKTNFGKYRASGKVVTDQKLEYLDGEQAIGKMKIAKGMEIKLFASEKEFPELVNPVQMSFDTDGRLWVAAWHTYPHWDPLKELNDKLLIFPDEDGDGKADRCIVFADGLHNPTGFEFWNGGVIVACQPEILFLKDTDGDNKADIKIHLVSGIDSADTHCGANSFVYGPDGYMYFSEGIFHFTNIETPWGKPLRTKAPMLYRFNPRTYKIEEHFVISPNPHGIVIDSWGRLYATDATTGRGYYVGYPKAGTPHELYKKRVRPVAGFGRISGTHFPPENRGNLLICNTIGFLGILQHKVIINGADIHSEEVEPIVVSTDTNFRPVDVEIGADGAMYFLDWQNALIGHMQHNLRDPSRDHNHGRIYRITATDRPLLKVVKMSEKSIPELITLLASPEFSNRYLARIELSGRDSDRVLAAAQKWATPLDASQEKNAHHLTEALWLHQQHNRVNRDLLLKVLQSPSPEARAAATRTLGQWGGQIEDGTRILQQLAADPSTQVRAEVVVAAASFPGLDAAEIVFIASQQPQDPQLVFNIKQSRQVIDPYWRTALKEGKTLSKAGQKFVAKLGQTDETFGDEAIENFSQDSRANLLHLYLESPPRKKGELSGITYTSKARASKTFTVYQLRPSDKSKHRVVNAASYTADGKQGSKTIKFEQPWQVEPGDLFAHSGNGGPAYQIAPAGRRDLLYYPVDKLPAKGQSYELGQLKAYPQKRYYALRFLMAKPDDLKADVVIKTIPEQLRYDLKEFTVKAGKPFVLRFENPDNMPHNIVFTLIGAKDEIGLLADQMAADPEAAKRAYLPDSPKVLFATPLIDDHAQITLEFTAPKKPGDYPFLCTFPGHWRIMQGIMKVVD